MTGLIIRRAAEGDAAELARLTSLLGYAVPETSIRDRIACIIGTPDDCLLVADGPEAALSGWIHGFVRQLLESEYRVEIGGLIVDERWRRNGVGRQLVRAIEEWAMARGAAELSVRCREEREMAHRFYESLSFRHTKTQRVFRRRIAPLGSEMRVAEGSQ